MKNKLIIKGWADFQHYKQRNPPWIKMHKSLLDNYDFQCLPLASRALAPMLWLLASESDDGSIDGDLDKMAFRLRWNKDDLEFAIKALIEKGFIVDASGVLAECKQHAMPETETETETEKTLVLSEIADDCPHEKIVALYHEHLPMMTAIKVWSPKRRALLKARWREDKRRQFLEYWEKLFKYIAQSDFLTGRTGDWQADLEWILNASNFVKIIEGKYDNKEAA